MGSDLVLFLIPSFIWGTTWLAIEFQLGVVPPEVSVGWRFALASPLLLSFCRLRRIPLRFGSSDHLRLVLLGLLLFGINYVLTYRSEQYLTSGLVSVLFALKRVSNPSRDVRIRGLTSTRDKLAGVVALVAGERDPLVAWQIFVDHLDRGVALRGAGRRRDLEARWKQPLSDLSPQRHPVLRHETAA